MDRLRSYLCELYSKDEVENLITRINTRLDNLSYKIDLKIKDVWNEEDVALIIYGNTFYDNIEKGFITLKKVYEKYFKEMFNYTHILPCFPYSSDDGFSVIDYLKINEDLGNWNDLLEYRKSSRIMIDFVCNHISSKSEWFVEYLKGNEKYENYFTKVNPNLDYSNVTRPRALPLFHEYNKIGEIVNIWTTFSSDQIDLNFQNPDVLYEMINILITYIENGSEWVRLDAIGYIWKDLHTNCIHHPKAHTIVKIFRQIVDLIKPGINLITETNVPHIDNISYFGNGRDEANMVYQFPLPPLVLYSILNNNALHLSRWASCLEFNDTTTFFNFLASHDGIGLNPIRGIISEEEIEKIVKNIVNNNGLVNYKNNSDGSKSPYEINSTYLDAISNKDDSSEIVVKKMLLAHSVLLTMRGIPAIYINSVIGASNNLSGVAITGENRTINREKFSVSQLDGMLKNDVNSKIYSGIKEMIQVRRRYECFSPNAKLSVINDDEELFIIKRADCLIIHNFSCSVKEISLSKKYEVLYGNCEIINDKIKLDSYEFIWLK